jgi:hypothetical protein
MRKYFESWIFNTILAVLAAFFAIMQEVWIDNILPFINFFLMGSAAAICLSLGAEIIKKVFVDHVWSNKDWITGAIYGIIVALVLALVV